MGIASNIGKLRAVSIVRWFQLALPVLVLFFQSNDLSLFQIFILQALFSVVVLVAEVPTGYFGDRFGWRTSLLCGSFVTLISSALFMVSSLFWQFALAEVLMGLSYCFFSGSDSALLYETLVDMQEQSSYRYQEGRLLACSYASEGVAAVLGAILASISLRFPFYVEFAIFLLLVPLVMSLIPPSRSHSLVQHYSSYAVRSRAKKDFRYIVNYVLTKSALKWVVIYSGFISFLTLSAIWLMQVYFKQTGLPVYWLGVFWSLLNMSRSLTSYWVCFFDYRFGAKKLFLYIPLIVSACFFLMGYHTSIIMMLLGLVIQAMHGLKLPLVCSMINQQISAEMRASVLSLDGMISRLLFIIVSPFIGYVADLGSLHVALYVLGGLALVGGLLVYLPFRRTFMARLKCTSPLAEPSY